MSDGFLTRIRNWGRKREEHRSSMALEKGVPQDPGTYEDLENEPASGDQTGRYQRRRTIDLFGLFKGPADASKTKHAKAGTLADPIIADLLLDHWADFFKHFREDEKAFELARCAKEAEQVQAVLDELDPDARPDLVTCRQMLFLLKRLAGQRFESWDERLDMLLAQTRDQEAQLNAVKLSTSWQKDELEYCRDIISDAMKRRDTWIPKKSDGEPVLVSELLCGLLNITKAPPRPKAARGRRATTRAETTVEPGADVQSSSGGYEPVDLVPEEVAVVQRTLRDLLAGKATRAKLHRVLGDRELAAELHEVISSVRQYKTILAELGLLPHAQKHS